MLSRLINARLSLTRAVLLTQVSVPSLTVLSRGLATSPSKEPLSPTLIEKYRLDDPTRWIPLTVGSLGAASLVGLYHWDAESQMLGLFILYVATIYSQAGGAIVA